MQKVVNTIRTPIHAKIHIPGSHLITLRSLLLASLAEGVSEISNINLNSDSKALLNALHQLGIVTQLDENNRSCIVAGGNGLFPKKQSTVWCDNSIITARFLLAACAKTPGVFYFDTAPEIRNESIEELLEILKRQGVQLIPSDAHKFPFTLVGTDSFEGGEIILQNETYHHTLSAMLMMAPFARTAFTFKVSPASLPMLELTAAMMAEFQVLVHRIHQGQLMVPVPQRYQAQDYVVEPDFALAAYFFAAAAVTQGELTIQPVRRNQNKESNVKFLSVLEKMGCQLRENQHGLTLSAPQELQGIEVSMRHFSDTFLALSAIAPFAKSPTRISHLGNIQPHEQTRLQVMKNGLIKMGIHVEAGENWIKIFPGTPKGGIVDTLQDPHIAMAFVLLGLKTPGVILEDEKIITDLYPEFFKLWNQLTAESHIKA